MGAGESTTGQQMLAAARALLPQIRAAADQIEQDGQLPPALVEALAAADLFRAMFPRSLGGSELAPEAVVRIVETLATADGSTGWCVGIPAQSGLMLGYIRPEAARPMVSSPTDYVSLVTFAGGRASEVAGGYRLSGRWSFASGCRHATWLVAGGSIHDGAAPRLDVEGRPEQRFFVLPVADCTIHNTWRVTGLRGTGSHDFTVEDAFVPTERVLESQFQAPQDPAQIYAFRFGSVAPIFAGTALGIARGALDALARLAASKVPRAGGGTLLRDQPVAQHRVGVVEAQLRGARVLLYQTLRDTWEEVGRAGPITNDQESLLVWASVHATAMAVQAVDTAWELAGGSAVFLGSAFERRFRDIHMVTQQFVVGPSRYVEGGRVFLSSPPAIE